MTTYYVDPVNGQDGTGGHNGTSMALAWKKISYALGQVASGDIIELAAGTYDAANQNANWYIDVPDKTLTLRPYQTGAVILQPNNGGTYGIRANTSCTAGRTFTFSPGSGSLTLELASTGAALWVFADKVCDVIFDGCTVTHTGTGAPLVYFADSTNKSSTVRFRNCAISEPHQLMAGYEWDILEFTNCNITIGAGSTATELFSFWAVSGFNSFIWRNNIITSTSATAFFWRATNSVTMIDKLIVENSTFHIAMAGLEFKMPYTANLTSIRNNTLTISNGTGSPGISLGLEYQTTGQNEWAVSTAYTANQIRRYKGVLYKCLSNHTSSANDAPEIGVNWSTYWQIMSIGPFIVSGNTVDFRNASAAEVAREHGIFLGPMARFGYCGYNRVYRGNYQIVNKGKGNIVERNVCVGIYPLTCFSGGYHKILGNTLYATQYPALTLDDQNTDTDVTHTHDNIVLNNIFDGSGGGDLAIHVAATTEQRDLIDYNCYQAGSSGIGSLGGTSCLTLQNLKDRWLAWGNFPYNEAHSLVADPLFVNAAGHDFSLQAASPCFNAGQPTSDGGFSNMGVWQGKQGVLATPQAGSGSMVGAPMGAF